VLVLHFSPQVLHQNSTMIFWLNACNYWDLPFWWRKNNTTSSFLGHLENYPHNSCPSRSRLDQAMSLAWINRGESVFFGVPFIFFRMSRLRAIFSPPFILKPLQRLDLGNLAWWNFGGIVVDQEWIKGLLISPLS
jgi:hypothetical protein